MTAVRTAEEVTLTYRDRALSIVTSTRPITRVWFDLLAPLAMVSLLVTEAIPLQTVAVGAAVILLLHVGATLISDSTDVDVDAASPERSRAQRVLVTGRGRSGDFRRCGAAMLFAGIGLSFLLGPTVGLLMVIGAAIAWAYSSAPLSLSGRPLWPQLIWPALWTLMYTAVAVSCHSDQWRAGVGFAIFVALFMGVGEGITQDIHDLDNDAAGGRRTTPAVLGVTRSVWVALAAQTLAAVAWLWFCVRYPMPWYSAVFGTLAVATWLAVFVVLSRALGRHYSKAAAKWTHYGSICAFSAVNVAVIAGTV